MECRRASVSMFGSFTGNTASAGTDWGEQMLNTVASRSIAHLFTKSESVDVQIRCSPSSKLLQGAIDSFKMSGRGLVIRKRFPVREMSFETDTVAIDFSSVLKGQLNLKQPTQAIAQVVLTEDGINESFHADLVTRRLQDLNLPGLESISGGNPVSFSNVSIELHANNRIQLQAIAKIPDRDEIPIALRTTIQIERRRRIVFTEAEFLAAEVPESLREDSEALSRALLTSLNDMVDLDRFDLDGVMLRLNRLETKGKTLLFSGYAQISHFPRSG
ncbi:LmeA family phospholipid-binding protein [Baaleninema simplex]|uniref:LmeA family phospholipid-binding protein n=1 Tax=Baaleninema simplex TaxID=2862350 RepID=UPI00316ACF60